MTWQAEAIKSAGLTVGEAADRLRVSWPKLNKAALSYALRSGETGVTLLGSVNRALEVLTGWKRPRRDNRRCPVRIQARLSKADSEAFNKARRAMGHRTINDALIYALRWYIAEAKRKVAVDVAASHDDKANIRQGHYMATGGNCQV